MINVTKIYTREEVFNRIKQDGLISVICKQELNHANIEDHELARMWMDLEMIMNRIQLFYLSDGKKKI